jgi:UDP-4-amino-4,6-dideoxy-N-acetyl-beta-L-altrosamine transaminase
VADGGFTRAALPYARQTIEADDIAAVVSVLKSDWLTQGPQNQGLAREFAQAVGAKFAVPNANGTTALHLACAALDLRPGDAAIVSSVTFVATANAVRYQGAEVIFADVDPDTGLMTPESFTDALAWAKSHDLRVRAALPVHLAGQSCNMQAIGDIAKGENIAIIEDACHAIGARVKRRDGDFVPVGACANSDMAIFSFHPTKTIAAGEGGMVTTNDPTTADRLQRLSVHGLQRDPAQFENPALGFSHDEGEALANPWYYELQELGFNYRLSELHAALALSQLRKLDRFVAERATLVEHYTSRLASFGPHVKSIGRVADCTPAWHLAVALIDFGALGRSRTSVMNALKKQEIGSQVHYLPVYRHPYYAKRYGEQRLPGAESYYARALALPLFVGMTKADVDRVVDTLASILNI